MAKVAAGSGCLIPFGGVFAAAGFFVLYLSLTQGFTSDDGTEMPPWFGVLFSLPFIVAGLGLMGFGIHQIKRSAEAKKLAAQHPNEPWMHLKVWRDNRIPASSGAPLVLLGIAIFWNAISWTFMLAMILKPEERPDNVLIWLFLGIFPLIGLGLAWQAVVQLARWARWGRSTLELAQVPGVLGGNIGGVITTPHPVSFREPIQFTLKCEEWVRDARNYNSLQTIWEQTYEVQPGEVAPLRAGSAIPFLFEIPFDLPESSVENSIGWKLHAKGKMNGPDFDAHFEVPVFRTAASREEATQTSLQAEATPAQRAEVTQSANEQFDIAEDHDGAWVIAKKKPKVAAFLPFVVVATGCVGVGIAMFVVERFGHPVMGIAFVLFGSLVEMVGVGVLTRKAQLRVYRDRIESRWQFLAWKGSRSLAAQDIKSIEADTDTRVNNQPWWHFSIEPQTGPKMSVHLMSPDKQVILELCAQIAQRLRR